MTTKLTIDSYFSNNNDKLTQVASNILKNINRKDLAGTLVTEAYMYILEKQERLEELINNGKIESIVINFMNKQVKWRGTAFKKTFIKTDSNLEIIDNYDYEDDTEDLEDLLATEYDFQQKLSHIESQKAKLDLPQSILYKLAIEGEYNTSGKLAKKLNINRTSCYFMLREMKEFLREGYENNDNDDN
tara:strand:+ start:407 stop:970 length:564 start_codon:yes stop_codon:yes gene_type:complete